MNDRPSKKALRVAIYCRFSAEMQSPRSIEDQRRECEKYALSHDDWSVVMVEADAATRAGATAGRTGYQRLLVAAGHGAFDVVLVEEISRFSRDFLGGIMAIAELKALGVKLADTKFGVIDPDEPMDQMRLSFGLMTSHDETRKLGARSKRGLKGKTLAKFSAGGEAPYGYRRVPVFSETDTDVDGRPRRIGVKFEIDEDQARWLRWIFERYAEGATKHGIARELNEMGVPTPRAGRSRAGVTLTGTWSAPAIKSKLENQIYRGVRVWNATSRLGPKHARTGKKKQMKNARDELVLVEGFAAPIIDEALFARVQERLAHDAAEYAARHKAGDRRSYLLSGFIACASCGNAFTIGMHVHGVPHYRCSFRTRGVCANKTKIPVPGIEAKLRDVLDTLAKDPQRLNALVAEHNERVARDNAGQRAHINELQRRIAEMIAEKDNLVAAIAAGGTHVKTLVEEIRKREEQIEELTTRVAQAEEALRPLLLPKLRAVRDYVAGATSLFDGEVVRDRHLLEAVIQKILIHEDGAIVIEFQEESLFSSVRSYRTRDVAAGLGESPLPERRAQAELSASIARGLALGRADVVEWDDGEMPVVVASYEIEPESRDDGEDGDRNKKGRRVPRNDAKIPLGTFCKWAQRRAFRARRPTCCMAAECEPLLGVTTATT